MKKIIFLFALLFSFSLSNAQEEKSMFDISQDGLIALSDSVMKGSDLKVRLEYNTKFLSALQQSLSMEGAFDYPFNGLALLSRIYAPDGEFRMMTWVVNSPDMSEFHYFGLIQLKNVKKVPGKIIVLKDVQLNSEDAISAKLNADSWYGAVYYRILLSKTKKKMHYTLLGWKGKDRMSTIKVIDGMSFNGETASFASNIFPRATRKERKSRKMYQRIIFEYNIQAIMSLKYDERLSKIVFDHLAPPNEKAEGIYSAYGPDFSYDALQFKGGKWLYYSDIDARSKSAPKGKAKRKTEDKPTYKSPK